MKLISVQNRDALPVSCFKNLKDCDCEVSDV